MGYNIKGECRNTGKTHFKKKCTPWNKGLTKETNNKIKELGIKFSEKMKKAWEEDKFKNRKIDYNETSKKISITRKRLFKEKKLKIWNYIDGRSKFLGPARYGDDWNKIRLTIYKRDNYTCQECDLKMSSKTGTFHIHHIIPFLQTFDNSFNNLVTLCPSCHRKIDAIIIKKMKGGLFKKQ